MTARRKKPKRPTCGAKARGGRPCKLVAGFGTNHVGIGKCKFHGGASTGPKSKRGKRKTSHNAEKHGFRTPGFRLRMREHRQEIEALLAEAESKTDPLDISTVAERLAQDARRLLSRLELLEQRADTVEADGKLDNAGENELHRRLTDFERALARVRAAQVQLASRFPGDPDADREHSLTIATPAGSRVFIGPKAPLPHEREDRDDGED